MERMRRGIPVLVGVVVVAIALWLLLGRASSESQAMRELTAFDGGAEAEASGDAKLKALRARAAAKPADAGDDLGPPSAPGVVATFGWGNGPGKLGRNRPEEANPEGPMSVTRDRAGNTWVLDQVNGRLVKLDQSGKAAGELPLTVQTPQDVAFTKDGTAAVLDRLVDSAVALMGPDGKQVGELKVLGKGIEEGGAITGVFTDGDDVYVEREHGDLVKLGDSKGKSDEARPEVPGRPSRDGLSYLSAGMADPTSGRVAVTSIDRASKAHRFTREVPFGAPIARLMLLDTDLSGVIYLGAEVVRPVAGSEEGQPLLAILCLDPLDGRPIGRAVLPANVDADETFRELTVLDEGGVMYLYRTEQKAEVMRVDCR
ncbi:MAG: hypothetical protein IPJ65_03405 [Archangiaceae bacterium]|nr:hypothetical protein [Archangiaceae bacterium]